MIIDHFLSQLIAKCIFSFVKGERATKKIKEELKHKFLFLYFFGRLAAIKRRRLKWLRKLIKGNGIVDSNYFEEINALFDH